MKWPPLSNYGKTGLAVSFVQAVVVIALEIVVSYYFISNVDVGSNEETEGSGKSITVYLCIFIFTQICQLILFLDAVWNQNTIQIFSHFAYCCCMVGFAVFQIFQIREALHNLADYYEDESYSNLYDFLFKFLVTSIVVLIVGTIIFGYLSFKLYLEFGWKIYKKIGADPRKRDYFRSYQILIMLLKYALYFFLAYAVQFCVLVLRKTDPEFGLTIFAIFISFFIVGIVVFALRHENKIIMGVWLGFCLLVIAYYAFKIGRIYDPTQTFKYIGSGKFLTLFASLGLGVTLVTFAYSIICFMNFGKGLKEHLSGQIPQPAGQDSGDVLAPGGQGQSRKMVLA